MRSLKEKISGVFDNAEKRSSLTRTEFNDIRKAVLAEIDAIDGKIALMIEEAINDNQDYAYDSLLQVLALLTNPTEEEKEK